MQQQINCVDFGLFAIAFATSLAHNENPVRRIYNTTIPRQHFVSCQEAGKLSLFSYHSINEKKDFKGTFNAIEIYCSC